MRTKNLPTFFFAIVISIAAFAQAPDIEWQNTIGGSTTDELYSIEQTLEGGFIIGGISGSGISGDKTENNLGGDDFWIIMLDSLGNIEWQNTIGGSGDENYFYGKPTISPTADGGFILGGASNSPISGDKTESNIEYSYDYWVLKLDNIGNIEWQNTLGGVSDDFLTDVKQTSDGGYILGGCSESPISFDKTEASWGGLDYWVLKLDEEGSIIWQNTIGGDQYDNLRSINQTSDGGYIVGGDSFSNISGDKIEESLGYWILKLNSSGVIVWQNTISAGNIDLSNIKETGDNGYIVGGSAYSGITDDKTESNIGVYDYWVLKLDSVGAIQWQNTIGGGNYDYLSEAIITNDGGYLLGGYSDSGISGDKSEASHGDFDYWIVKLNSIGNIVWQKTIGGWDYDALKSIKQTSDNGYILGGFSASPISFDKTEDYIGAFGNRDYWIIKLFPDSCFVSEETCNGLDDDCNGIIDDSYVYITYYEDADEDGFGNILSSITNCIGTAPAGYVSDSTDCNDLNSLINPTSVELCNGFDDNCNFIIDEDLTIYYYYFDYDEDGFGDALSEIVVCSPLAPIGYVSNSTDCNDLNELVNSTAIEVCNSYDDDCDFLIDEGFLLYVYFLDADDDGFGNDSSAIATCSDIAPYGYVTDNSDCDDSNTFVHEPLIYYEDVDGDLYGDPFSFELLCESIETKGFVSNQLDCDDTNFYINPGSNEICNELDDNCNILIDEDLYLFILYRDADNDNYGNSLIDTTSCYAEITGYISDSADCDDSNPDIYPGATEILNGLDDNCNKEIDEGLVAISTFNSVSFQVYPNPNNGSFNITFQHINSAEINIDVYNFIGEKIYSQIVPSTNNLQVNLPEPFSGIANIVITIEGNSMSHTLFVIK